MSDDGSNEVRRPVLLAGRYRVEEELGRGGMAKVFKGTDTVLGRPVAVKVLAPHYADDANFVSRFRREAQAAARLNHPNLVGVYDTGSDDGVHYIVMEYVDAKTLADYVAGGGRIMPDRAIELAEDVCRALAVAHAHGVIHRDIKPANIMVTPRGEVKVTDFGIARVTSGADTVAQTAAVLGTASYLSPEQARGEPVDQRSDLYSLGVVLYEMVTGKPPFSGDTPVAVASKHVLEQPVPPSKTNPDVPAALDAVIMKALSKNPSNRYQSAEEFRQDLERVRLGQPVGATPLLAEDSQTQMLAPPAPAAGGPTAVLPPQPPAPEEPRRRWWVGVIVTVLILAALGAGGYILATGLLSGNGQTQQVRVPNVVGFTQSAAESTLKDAGFVPKVVTKVTSNAGEIGNVLEQTPQGSVLAKRGDDVTITVGKAPKQVTVPNVVGMSQTDAETAITDAGLKVGNITPQADAASPGTVIGQNPAADSPVDKGSTVDLVVSSGPQMVSVPDVRCESFGQAKQALRDAGLNPIQSSETRPLNPACPNGNKVADQDPAPNAQVQAGSDVTLYPGEAAPSPTESPSPTP